MDNMQVAVYEFIATFTTIKKKGKATPLIDTRDMFNAISYEVVDGRSSS